MGTDGSDRDPADALRRAAAGLRPDPAALERTMGIVARRRTRRRIAAGSVAAVLSLSAVVGLWMAFEPMDRERGAAQSPSASPPPTVDGASAGADELPAGWTWCANDALGFRIAHPVAWFTTASGVWPNGDREHVPELACHFFDPEPFEIGLTEAHDRLDTDGIDHHVDRMVAFHVTLSSEALDAGLARLQDGTSWAVLDVQPTMVGGDEAVTMEYREGDQRWSLTIVDLGTRGSLWFSVAQESPSDPDVARSFPRWSELGRAMLATFQPAT